MRPAGIIAQRIHLGAVGGDHMQQIWQPHIGAVPVDQRRLSVLARALAFPALEPHHGGGVLGKENQK